MTVYSSFCLFLLTLDWEFLAIGSSNTMNVDGHLHMGIELTAKGQFAEALSHFHAAVDLDPNNYLTYYRRATVYLALGKSKSALPDLEQVIRLKPDFTAALLQKGNILLKQGRLDEAHISFEAVLRREPDNQEALQQYSVIEPIRREVQDAFQLTEMGNYMNAIESLTRPIEHCPWDPHLRELRSECFLSVGDSLNAVRDLKFVTKLRGDSTEAHRKLSILHYQLGEADESLTEIRECLKLDQDNKLCFTHYKKVKKLAGYLAAAKEALEAQDHQLCVEKTQAASKIENEQAAFSLLINTLLCQCYPKAGSPTEGIQTCTKALQLDEDVTLLCYRAEAHIANEDYQEAIQDYQKALQLDEGAACAKQGINQAQKLQKQSQKRDYYKILGVKRTATKQEITKAYRKAAQKWHPDNFGEDEKKMAEMKFIDIAAAKEVLTDPEKRQKFDQGEDPLDPETQAGQNFNPFQSFHGAPGSGPFQFRFHFN